MFFAGKSTPMNRFFRPSALPNTLPIPQREIFTDAKEAVNGKYALGRFVYDTCLRFSVGPSHGWSGPMRTGRRALLKYKEQLQMANFTVRVELHQATFADHEVLHTMEEQCLSRLITAHDGQTCPSAWAKAERRPL